MNGVKVVFILWGKLATTVTASLSPMPACCCMTTDCTLVKHQSPEWSLQLTKTKTETKWVVFKCIEDRKHIFRSLNCALVVHYTIHWQMKHLKIWTPGQRWSKVRSPHIVSHCPRCRFDPWDWIWNASSVINFIMCVATATRPFTMRLFLHLHVFKRQIWWTQEGEKVNSDLTEIESEC